MQHRRTLLSRKFAAIVALLMPWLMTPAAAAERPDSSVLIELAHRYLQDRATRVTNSYTPLVSSAPSRLTSAVAAEAFAARISAETPELDRLRAKFAGTLSEFSHAQVTIDYAEAKVTGSSAELQITETTDLYLAALARSLDAPTSTSSRAASHAQV